MHARILYIVRGLPSAGKTTLARAIAPSFNVSMEEWPTHLQAPPEWFGTDYNRAFNFVRGVVASWMDEGVFPIAVHGVFAQRNDITPWILLAVTHGYQWSVIHVTTDLNDADLAGRSMTKCPTGAIASFRARWEPWGA